jgi:hypothetical protein
LLGLQPLVPLLLLLAGAVALRRRDLRVLAPVAVLGAVLAFDNLVFLGGSSFGWLRFQITAVPLAVLLVGLLIAGLQVSGSARSPARRAAFPALRAAFPALRAAFPALRAGFPALRAPAVAAAVVAVAVATPVAVATLATPRLAREESEWFTADGARRTAGLARVNARVARDLDAMALPEGSVLTDAAYAFSVILASGKPTQFVISSDRDFVAALADPAGHRVRYVLVSATGAADAVRRAHPQVASLDAGHSGVRTWADGAGTVQWMLVPVSALP